MRLTPYYFVFFLCLTFSSCTDKNTDKLFRLKDGTATGLTFNNQIFISDSLNGVSYEYIYNGGGAAVGDINNDGLKDLFFAGNMVSSRLYLNRGELMFEEITEASGTITDKWCTGTSMVDINGDDLLDIYVCVAGPGSPSLRKNIFFINQGIDNEGIPHFVDQATSMGLDDDGYSTMGVFFDFDKDKDLDMYLLTNSMDGINRNMVKPIRRDGSAESTDRLFRNDGEENFVNISKEAGILIEGHGLGIGLCDINQDNWTDIYCANDFISNDLLWINNQDGTFTEKAGEYFKHFTNNGMGMDIADYNNDGLLDVSVVDMMPVSNIRQKLMFVFRNMDRMNQAIELGFLPQFMRNTLQLNMGKFPDGRYRFSELGYMAGIYQTDWSWAPLMVDFDNDGWKDMLITNGYRKDVTNLDYLNEIIRKSQFGTDEGNQGFFLKAMDDLPDVKIHNYIFRNKGDLTFEDKSAAWGLDIPTFSNGTITADLDNDGDIDIVVNNIDQEVYLYENRLNKLNNEKHFLKILFDEQVPESDKIGTKIWVFQKENNQYFEYSPYRGYKSTVDPDIHVGLGADIRIDSIIIQWPDGMVQREVELQGDSSFVISRSENLSYCAGSFISQFNREQEALIFKNISDSLNLQIKHSETKINDIQGTPSLIRSLSKNGPSLSVGDLDNDGLEDLILGNDMGKAPVLFKQEPGHTFSRLDVRLDSLPEDMGSLLFDADGDDDLDLYMVSGGSARQENDKDYQDRLYVNDGSGGFKLNRDALPDMRSSGSCVIAGDYDRDSDLDLFVGGRLVPKRYPSSPQSYLLENVNGKFHDRSEKLGEKHGLLGMVTSALWTDVNNDNIPDLMVVGEWMQITLLLNLEGSFVDQSEAFGLGDSEGWWNSINGGDFDNDGDTDYLLGNYGLNSFYKASKDQPLEIYGKDFDRNGTFDPVMTNYILGESYIVHPRNTLIQLIPGIENRFFTYESYGNTPFNKAFTPLEIEGTIHLTCKMMQSVMLENVDGQQFKIHDLPMQVQCSPVFGTILEDFNNDNQLDAMIIGNSMADESIAGYYDASYGNIMINRGDFKWDVLDPSKTNIIADGDKKALAKMIVDGHPVYIMTENDGYLQAYAVDSPQDLINMNFQQNDWYFTYEFNGKKMRKELYHGSGFLSSSSRISQIPKGVLEIEVYNYDGSSRKINLRK